MRRRPPPASWPGRHIEVAKEPFGDIWLRDTGPIVLKGGGQRSAASFRFNGWGGKYELEGDDTVGLGLATTAGFKTASHDWILEGGAIDVDGTGLAVTTEQCLLNPNRNADLGREDIEARLRSDLGIERVLWLGEGLLNDHTDGHIDNLARFVGEGRIAIPVPAGTDDPNAAVYPDAKARAEAFGLEVVPLPSPGLVTRDGEIVPASYMNFYIGNAAVVVPLYGAANDEAAVHAIGALFPGRRAVGFRADHILTGGGSFHCISQQVPK
jgi:agmatine deiminase